jgi:hypothetical protein
MKNIKSELVSLFFGCLIILVIICTFSKAMCNTYKFWTCIEISE